MLVFLGHDQFPLYEVNVRVHMLAPYGATIVSPHATPSRFPPAGGSGLRDTEIDIGTTPANAANVLGDINLPASGVFNCNVFFSARNGFWTEQLRARRVGGEWKVSVRVTRRGDDDQERVLFEKVEEGYPREAGG